MTEVAKLDDLANELVRAARAFVRAKRNRHYARKLGGGREVLAGLMRAVDEYETEKGKHNGL
jgi:hypothetical protein